MESTFHALNPWWHRADFSSGIPRQTYVDAVPTYLARPQIEVFIGSRRAGKTTILRQIVRAILAQGVAVRDLCYLALDHPALSATPLSGHLKLFRRLHNHERDRMLYLFLDEVQESTRWEVELKALYDLEHLKVFITGSTAALLQSQGGKLTGRQIVSTVYPLSFREFIGFRGGEPSLAEDYRFERLVDEYLEEGGYPEQVLRPSPEYLGGLVEDILAHDLVRLVPIKKPLLLKDLLRLVASSVGSRTSFNKLGKLLGLSVDTVRDYLHHMESAFLLSFLEKWTPSWSEKTYAQKKIYLQDTGVRTIFTGAGDKGSKAENCVFMALKRSGSVPGYFAESELEVDFVIGSPAEPLPVEVKYVDRFDWQDRRFAGLKLFLRRHPTSRRAVVISRSVQTEARVGTVNLQVIPLWKFLLDPAATLQW